MENMYNLNIERAVLSAIIFDPEIYEEIASKLAPHDFYLPFHQHMFTAMEELNVEEKPLDDEFLRAKLVNMGKFDEVAMLDILSANPISNTTAYILEIKAKASKRALATLATEIKKTTIEDDLPAEEVMNLVEKKLYEITQNNANVDFRESKEITTAMMAEIERLKSLGNSMLIGTDTGFRGLNEKTSGFGKGDLVIIAARPAMGKTALVLNMALKAIERNEGVAFFSLEMPAEQLMLRMLSAKTSIPLQSLRVGDLTDEQWSQLSAATEDISKRKLFVDDGGHATIHQVRSKLRKLKSQHPEISVAIIDYLQLMSGDGKEGRQQEVSEISRGLKQLARELQIPILALSQLNRGLENRDNKRPMLSDLRESGAIEQDADIILFVYRGTIYKLSELKEKIEKAKSEGQADNIQKYQQAYDELNGKQDDETELIIGKQRNGPTGTVKLSFQKRFTRFVDAAHVPAFEIEYEDADIPMQEGNINVEMPPI
jgi:replicative DNA helicase